MSPSSYALAAAVLLAGCTFPNHRDDLRVREAIAPGDHLSGAFYQSVGVAMSEGNQVELIHNGAIFDEMEKAILEARTSVHLLSYIWRPSSPSNRLVRALLSKTREGVVCRVLYDPFGSVDFEQVRIVLTNGGCDVRPFRPFGPGERLRIFSRNHRKIGVVDGRIGFTGGFGIWTSWEGHGRKPDEWREVSVRVEGPAVREMQLAFSQNWQEAGGRLLPEDAFPPLAARGTSRAAFVASAESVADTNAERMFQLLIASAQSRIWIANSYFIPSTAVAGALIEKAKQGVDVRVLAPGTRMDIPVIRAAQISTYQDLLGGGVRIWEYGPSMMHAKTFLVDDDLVVVGSTNLDPLSLRRNEEGSLVVEDRELARQMEEAWEDDLRHSREIRWDSWRRRGLAERLPPQLTSLIGQFL